MSESETPDSKKISLNKMDQKEIIAGIQQLKQSKNAIILAHYYQEAAIQDLADYVGDSFGLSQKAADTDAAIIVFAGVKFMAETAKILSPDKKVLMPDVDAGCTLADYCPADQFKAFIDKYPDHAVVTYINSNTEVKAMSDYICTSSNARNTIDAIPVDKKIIFAPDKNLGKYLINQTGRDMILWNGTCEVHESFSVEKVKKIKANYPNAEVIAHPECGYLVLEVADFIGSTGKLLNYIKKQKTTEFIVVTEEGILHEMKKASPEKRFIPAPPVYYTDCSCGECPYMKLNTIEKIHACLENETFEINISEDLRKKALVPIRKMLTIS